MRKHVILALISIAAGAATAYIILRMMRRREIPVRPDEEEEIDLFEEAEGEVYKLSFPDGTPVHEGQLQEWLNLLRSDPDVSDEEYMVAAGIVKQIRAHLN